MEKRNGNKIILLLAVLLATAGLRAQTTPDPSPIEVGKWVKLAKCKSGEKNFATMDLYVKTRIPEKDIKIDSVTGEGIFEKFFAPGDFDAKRLPCEYGNKKYRIAALRTFEVEGKEKRVMILYTPNKLAMIWVEFDAAIEQKELTW